MCSDGVRLPRLLSKCEFVEDDAGSQEIEIVRPTDMKSSLELFATMYAGLRNRALEAGEAADAAPEHVDMLAVTWARSTAAESGPRYVGFLVGESAATLAITYSPPPSSPSKRQPKKQRLAAPIADDEEPTIFQHLCDGLVTHDGDNDDDGKGEGEGGCNLLDQDEGHEGIGRTSIPRTQR